MSALVKERAILQSKPNINTNNLLQVLSETNNAVATIANGLKQTVDRINNGNALWTPLGDTSLRLNLKYSLSRPQERCCAYE